MGEFLAPVGAQAPGSSYTASSWISGVVRADHRTLRWAPPWWKSDFNSVWMLLAVVSDAISAVAPVPLLMNFIWLSD